MSIQGHCPQCGLDMHTIYHSAKWQGHKNCLQAPPLRSWVLPQRVATHRAHLPAVLLASGLIYNYSQEGLFTPIPPHSSLARPSCSTLVL